METRLNEKLNKNNKKGRKMRFYEIEGI